MFFFHTATCVVTPIISLKVDTQDIYVGTSHGLQVSIHYKQMQSQAEKAPISAWAENTCVTLTF